MQGYEEIFNQRGKSYHLAMEKYPHARDEEFYAAIKRLQQRSGSVILDLPAGGGYLKQHLRTGVNYLAYDFSGEFNDNHAGIKKCKESKVDLQDESVDEIVSLAALHHIVARREFYSEMHRVLKPGGQLIIGDAVKDSKLDSFLNGFLDRWNSMGHHGNFIKSEDLMEMKQAGFQVEMKVDEYYWNFNTQKEAIDFFRLLFCLDLNPPDHEVVKEFDLLGIKMDHGFSVSWSLGFVVCTK
ncbi:MAG: methyltransferase domain-containing protein [Ekhidna sp.]